MTLLGARPGDTDRGATVGNTVGELVNGTSLMATSKTEGVIITVDGNVLLMPLGELVNSRLNVLHAAGLTHGLSGDIGVKAGTVPVTTISYIRTCH